MAAGAMVWIEGNGIAPKHPEPFWFAPDDLRVAIVYGGKDCSLCLLGATQSIQWRLLDTLKSRSELTIFATLGEAKRAAEAFFAMNYEERPEGAHDEGGEG